MVESNGNSTAIGDNGKSLGAYQLSKEYIMDVNRVYKTNYIHEDAFDDVKSSDIVSKYLTFYGNYYKKLTGNEPTNEIYARIHNGGPYGWSNDPKYGGKNSMNRYKNTTIYWRKVRKYL
jgi:hypothetical protein